MFDVLVDGVEYDCVLLFGVVHVLPQKLDELLHDSPFVLLSDALERMVRPQLQREGVGGQFREELSDLFVLEVTMVNEGFLSHSNICEVFEEERRVFDGVESKYI